MKTSKTKQVKQSKQGKRPKQIKRSVSVRDNDERRRNPRNDRRAGEAPPRRKPTREQRPMRSAPKTGPVPRPKKAPGRPKNADQAKARAKARKAKAPKVVRPPLRERIIVRLASIDLNPRTLVARVPFVVLVIGALGAGLGTTLWLSTDAAERSYQLGHARNTNQALLQQKEALERDVLEAQAAPALAEAARGLGMIPSRDTAHLVQDPSGNWIVVGTPKPAEGVPPPPLNTPLPDEAPPAPPPPPAARVTDPREVTVRVPQQAVPGAAPLAAQPAPGTPIVPPAVAPGSEVPHAAGATVPAPGPLPIAGPAMSPAAPAAPVIQQPLTVPLPGPPA